MEGLRAHLGGVWLALAPVLHLLAAVAVTLHCSARRREATAAVLWILLAWLFPVAGPLLYLVFGVDRLPAHRWRRRTADARLRGTDRAQAGDSEADLTAPYWRRMREGAAAPREASDADVLNTALDPLAPDFPLLGGHALTLHVSGPEAYPAMLRAIAGARRHIHLQTFILGRDAVARAFLDALLERARAGVRVRVLYDRFGSTAARYTGLLARYGRASPNLRLVGWTPFRPLRRRFQFNLRNHRKILVVDGEIAFTGGLNISGVNANLPRRPASRDYQVEVRGPAVHQLQYTFLADWHYATGEAAETLLDAAHFPPAPAAGPALVRVVNGGPDGEPPVMPDAFFNAIVSARREVLVATPYFVPTPDILRAFRSAALRGRRVRIVVPARNNHWLAGLAARALYADLLDAGVRIFERRPPFLHAKALIVDDTLALVGSANLDVRSLRLHYETNLAVFDPAWIDRLKQALLEDLARSDEIDPAAWARRSAVQRIAENLAALFAPLL